VLAVQGYPRLSKAVQALKLSVAVQREQRPFWQARYYDFNVFTTQKHIEKLKYIHRTPVTRGLVEKPEEWPWSSYNHDLTGAIGTVEIESWWTGTRRASGLAETHIPVQQPEIRPGPPARLRVRGVGIVQQRRSPQRRQIDCAKYHQKQNPNQARRGKNGRTGSRICSLCHGFSSNTSEYQPSQPTLSLCRGLPKPNYQRKSRQDNPKSGNSGPKLPKSNTK